jgi:hypothetical protein
MDLWYVTLFGGQEEHDKRIRDTLGKDKAYQRKTMEREQALEELRTELEPVGKGEALQRYLEKSAVCVDLEKLFAFMEGMRFGVQNVREIKREIRREKKQQER